MSADMTTTNIKFLKKILSELPAYGASALQVRKRKGKVKMATDPIADMLTRIRNANTVGHETVEIPSSKL